MQEANALRPLIQLNWSPNFYKALPTCYNGGTDKTSVTTHSNQKFDFVIEPKFGVTDAFELEIIVRTPEIDQGKLFYLVVTSYQSEGQEPVSFASQAIQNECYYKLMTLKYRPKTVYCRIYGIPADLGEKIELIEKQTEKLPELNLPQPLNFLTLPSEMKLFSVNYMQFPLPKNLMENFITEIEEDVNFLHVIPMDDSCKIKISPNFISPTVKAHIDWAERQGGGLMKSVFSAKVTEIFAFFTIFQCISTENIELLTEHPDIAMESLQMTDYFDLQTLKRLIRLLIYSAIYQGKISDFDVIWNHSRLINDEYLKFKLLPILLLKFSGENEKLKILDLDNLPFTDAVIATV